MALLRNVVKEKADRSPLDHALPSGEIDRLEEELAVLADVVEPDFPAGRIPGHPLTLDGTLEKGRALAAEVHEEQRIASLRTLHDGETVARRRNPCSEGPF